LSDSFSQLEYQVDKGGAFLSNSKGTETFLSSKVVEPQDFLLHDDKFAVGIM